MGLAPLTGVPLPFLSYGGSFTLSLLISIALVQRVCIETKKVRWVMHDTTNDEKTKNDVNEELNEYFDLDNLDIES